MEAWGLQMYRKHIKWFRKRSAKGSLTKENNLNDGNYQLSLYKQLDLLNNFLYLITLLRKCF